MYIPPVMSDAWEERKTNVETVVVGVYILAGEIQSLAITHTNLSVPSVRDKLNTFNTQTH